MKDVNTVDQAMADKLSAFFRTQPTVDKAWLFGSCARGEATPESDVDVLVRFQGNARVTLFSYASMQHKMEQLLNKRVDLVEDGRLKDFARASAEADKVLIYDSNE
jgi:hypothetical protein